MPVSILSLLLYLFLGGVIGFTFCLTIVFGYQYLVKWRYPIGMLVLKEVGGTMPRPIYCRARVDGDMIKGKAGLVKPRFSWKKQFSDILDFSYWRSNINVYPIMIKSFPKIKLKKEIPFFRFEQSYSGLGLHTPEGDKPASARADKEGNIIIETKKTEGEAKDTEFDGIGYNFCFSKEDAEIMPIRDSSIVKTTFEMIKDTANRFSIKDFFEKWAAPIALTIVLAVVTLYFAFSYGMFNNFLGAIKDGVRVQAEVVCTVAETVVPPITTRPPLPISPPPIT